MTVFRALRGSGWLTVYAVVVVSQIGHLAEHVAQMVQIHGLGIANPHAHGVVGNLDLEWVHFVWNVAILVVLALILRRLPRNPWSWLAFGIAAWHSAEHTIILAVYLSTNVPGHPGLLALDGVLFGGGPLVRPDLHFVYNVAETVFLAAGFAVNWRTVVRESRTGGGVTATALGVAHHLRLHQDSPGRGRRLFAQSSTDRRETASDPAADAFGEILRREGAAGAPVVASRKEVVERRWRAPNLLVG